MKRHMEIDIVKSEIETASDKNSLSEKKCLSKHEMPNLEVPSVVFCNMPMQLKKQPPK